MQIALFGGAFDPPHIGHQFITKTLLEKKLVDEVWYVPVKQHPFGKNMLPDEVRLEMLQFIIPQNEPRIRIETYELEKPGISYTYETFQFLEKKYPDTYFSWVIGSDNLGSFDKWLDVHPQLLEYPFLVYPRQGFTMGPLYPNMTPLMEVEEVAVSSTQVREQAARGESITDLVDPEVAQYINNHHLYVTATT